MTLDRIGMALSRSLAISSVIFLAGCVAMFDNNEYSAMVTMRAELNPAHCEDTDRARNMAQQVAKSSQWLVIYSRYLPDNHNTVTMVNALDATAKDFQDRYQSAAPSAVFCRTKVKIMQNQLDTILDTTARRPRR